MCDSKGWWLKGPAAASMGHIWLDRARLEGCRSRQDRPDVRHHRRCSQRKIPNWMGQELQKKEGKTAEKNILTAGAAAELWRICGGSAAEGVGLLRRCSQEAWLCRRHPAEAGYQRRRTAEAIGKGCRNFCFDTNLNLREERRKKI
ncbi:hypothetical protein Dsin_019107 [Dipteronia sinensis]|uniref:Uncharacterized protein n=1 Tax=Dipteronia sinensis TaxID=43782 RepID=A0AAE0E2Q8_9ROSI|nr:hypothetical protein Dsin_019107 [Dipteronia sinensis]